MLQSYCSYGEIAQLARAIGSYPIGRGFDPLSRYHVELTRLYLVFLIFIDIDEKCLKIQINIVR